MLLKTTNMVDLVMNVDDDSMGQMLSEIILSDHQFCQKIVNIHDGKKALDYFEEQLHLPVEEQKIPALLFLDINMPVMDGWDFLRVFHARFKAFHKKIKIIVLTSSLDHEEELKAIGHPLVFKYIAKPLESWHVSGLKKHPAFVQEFAA